MRKYIFLLILITLLFSCKNENLKIENNEKFEELNLKYANLFSIKVFENYTELTVFSEDKKTFTKYYLVDKKKEIPTFLSTKNIIRIPVERIICLSTTHTAYIDLLGNTDNICGVSDKKYICNSKIQNNIEKKVTEEVGYEQMIDYEKLISLKPDLVTIYNIEGEISSVITKLKSLNIPVVLINEYSEQNILGQAEWIKFFGEFFDKRNLSDKISDSIFYRYNELKSIAQKVNKKPTVMLNLPWKGVWYIPGNNSNIAQLINDAGGNYKSLNNENMRNFPADISNIYLMWRNNDFWLNSGDAVSVSEIIGYDSRLSKFKSVKTKNIYNRNNRMSNLGGNDFMESGVVKPDVILKDIITILHPELKLNHTLYYYKKLK
jgi:iron complex transport system substrate-binding protein